MNTRDQFGNYLLLKKLAEDPLGEVFRGGRVGRQGLERVVLLRVLNGQGFDAERVARAIQARSSLAQALKSPNIGQAVDVGQVRGVPYTAYDYSSGRSLAQLLEQSARRNNPMPLDHALLVAERVALALAVAYETRFGDDRVQHGFVTPFLVHVSNEGELKLLGFEASAGLRESAAHPIVKQAAGRYLAPEVVAGQPPSRADDVYSLGALLFEMLTGQQIPLYPPTGLAATIDQAVIAAEGTHMSAELAGLLKRTLCPRDQRVPDVVTWHKALAKLMADAQLSATTFNLAFYLHGLFRDEIEREGRELESEKAQAVSLAAAAPPRPAEAAAAPASAIRETGPVREDTGVLREEYGLNEKKGGPPMGAILGGIAAVVVLAGVGYFVFGRGGGSETPPQAAAAPVAQPAPQPQAPAGPTPEELQAQIAKMVAEQSKQAEASLRAKYDEELKALQQQLEESRKSRTVASQAPPVTIATTPQRPVETPAAPAPEVRQAPAATPPAATTASQQPAAAPQPQPAAPAAKETPAPAPRTTPPAPAVQPQAPSVRVGDLVTPGPGVTSPRVLRQPALRYPPVAKRLRKEATVVVRVLVDENGRSVDVQSSGDKVGYGMDEAAMDFARGCQWDAARKDGIRVKMWTELKVAFKL